MITWKICNASLVLFSSNILVLKLSEHDEKEFERLFIKKHGIPPIHTNLKFSKWNVSVWDDQDICSIIAKPRHVAMELDALWSEMQNTDRNTTVKPLISEFNSSVMKEPIIYDPHLLNILTNLGMKDMAQNRTGESTNTNTHCFVGDDATGELVSDDELGNQILAKAFDTDGDRETVDQQERYAMAFFRSDFGSDVVLREAGIGTGDSPPTDILTAHVTFADKPIGPGQTMTVQITVTHKNGTQ